ncbi:MAG: capsule assembly Wzi family protein [Cyclobacteriaceae bacterium]
MRQNRRYFIFNIFIVAITLSDFCYSQTAIPNYEFYNSGFTDTTALSLKTSTQYLSGDYFKVLDPMVKMSFNSAYARGYNDGAVWQGKGVTSEAHFGIQGKKGIFSYTLQPVVFFSQNSDFDLATAGSPNLSPYNYQFAVEGGIDYTQQYGTGAFTKFHLGQSEIKLNYKSLVASVSTQNFVLGPATFNPIIMSTQAGGFPHLRLGIVPTDISIGKKNIGKLEGYLIYGLLQESDYFDNDQDNDNRYFSGLTGSFTPAIVPSLTIGFHRTMYKNTEFFESKDLIAPIFVLDDGVQDGNVISVNDAFDQMAAVSIEWKFIEQGFRAYAEFAKNDFASILEPEHSRGYTLGFEKNVILKENKSLDIVYEHTNLSRNHSYLWRPTPPFYVHGVNRHGYTHRGQILGAGIGPGSNADQMNIRFNKAKSQLGFSFQRIEFNKDYLVINLPDEEFHDVEYSVGTFYRKNLEKIDLTSELIYSMNLNRYYAEDQSNLYFSLAARYKL